MQKSFHAPPVAVAYMGFKDLCFWYGLPLTSMTPCFSFFLFLSL